MTISLLSPSITEIIAAGEVIERPLSVVKELVENSIDSGAKNIEVEIASGGLEFIRVTDNGSGMNFADLELCIMRHATSKISSVEDLNNINTMGFRGEALASIDVVSNLEIITASAGDGNYGYQLNSNIRGEVDIKEYGKVLGTSVRVSKLFSNLPARLKFLKTSSAEASKIQQYLNNVALGYPELSFCFIKDGSQVFNLQGIKDQRTRAAIIWSANLDDFENIDFSTPELKISGLCGTPSFSWHNRTRQVFFVNRRLIKSSLIEAALRTAFKDSFLGKKYPVAVINIEISPDSLDVNIHPQKTEIKFLNDEIIFQMVHKAMVEALHKGPRFYSYKHQEMNVASNPTIDFDKVASGDLECQKNTIAVTNDGVLGEVNDDAYLIFGKLSDFACDKDGDELAELRRSIYEGAIKPVKLDFFKFAVFEKEDALLFVDQHALHEKYIYETLCNEYQNERHIHRQRLLIPYFGEFDFEAIAKIEGMHEILGNYGYIVETFGDKEIVFREVPALLADKNFINPFSRVIELYGASSPVDDILKSMACHSATKLNKSITEAESLELLRLIIQLKDPLQCPHGRPSIFWIHDKEIERGLKRRL